MTDVDTLAEGVRRRDRRALARAITLVESRRDDHRRAAEDLLIRLMPTTGASIRIAISGVPGVGKSTFIEAFGRHLTGAGRQLAVLAIDPSSQRSGGSILGDKTRMETLSRDPAAFVRPSPAGGTLGGVARRTRETILLCEAAGHDVVLVETVGVGQSEISAAGMTDLFLLLLLPGAGDELQGIKRGIVEVADILVVNKADGAMLGAANHAAAEYRHALSLLRSGAGTWTPEILQCSSVTSDGIAAVADAVERYRSSTAEAIAARRRTQARDWLWSEIGEALREAMTRRLDATALDAIEQDVADGRMPGSVAARRLVESVIGG